MDFFNNILNRLKSFFSKRESELERGERLYKEKYKNYVKTVTPDEAIMLSQKELSNLKEWFRIYLTLSLDSNVYYDKKDGTPYTIIWQVRWNLTDYVLVQDWYSSRKFSKMTLAEYLLPSGSVIVKPLREFVRHPDSATVIAIREKLPEHRFGSFAD